MLRNPRTHFAAAMAVLLALVFATPSHAATDSGTDKDKREKIVHMLELNGVTNSLPSLVGPNIDGVMAKIRRTHPDLSEEAREAINKEVQSLFNQLMDVTMDMLTDMYDRNFTTQEIEKLIEIYESPVWRKQVTLQGKMYRQMAEEMQRVSAPLMTATMERIRQRCEELGIEY